MNTATRSSSLPLTLDDGPLLVELAWEVCNQVGGIYTVLRSKAPAMVEAWGGRYCLVGPYVAGPAAGEYDPAPLPGLLGEAVARLQQELGDAVHAGRWMITGRPQVVLLDPQAVLPRIAEIRAEYGTHHHLEFEPDPLLDEVLAFGYLATRLLQALAAAGDRRRSIVAHFHEWMGAAALPELRRLQLPIATVFTTHATLLGRYLATGDTSFYDRLVLVDWQREAQRFGIRGRVLLERAAAHGAHVLTTVSDVTAWECEQLLGRRVDLLLPNGLNIKRFTALHEFQNLHLAHKQRLNEFVMAHFFQSYTFDLDNTLYFFTSGRYEYQNKGFDLTLEALARLNWRLRQANSPMTVVMFFITKQPYRSINPDVLQSRGVLDEIRRTCGAIQQQLGERLLPAAVIAEDGRLPDLESLVDDYWKLRLRRSLQAWKSHRLPSYVTHDLVDEEHDELVNFLKLSGLLNHAHDRVKIVYHPDFISPANPLWGMEYDHFVRGCHLGVFPSFYEPWGYTPLECMARGVPAVTSDLTGFGSYLRQHLPDHESRGLHVVPRRHRSFDGAASELTEFMWGFTQLSRRERIAMRNRVEESAGLFDWQVLAPHYARAHAMAEERLELGA